ESWFRCRARPHRSATRKAGRPEVCVETSWPEARNRHRPRSTTRRRRRPPATSNDQKLPTSCFCSRGVTSPSRAQYDVVGCDHRPYCRDIDRRSAYFEVVDLEAACTQRRFVALKGLDIVRVERAQPVTHVSCTERDAVLSAQELKDAVIDEYDRDLKFENTGNKNSLETLVCDRARIRGTAE